MGNRRVGRAPMAACMSCPLCKDIMEEATTISLCLHAFCKKCIYGRFYGEKFDTCPVCDAYLGATPEDKLRPDHNLQALQEKIFPTEKTGEASKSASPSGPPPSRRKDKSASSLGAAKTERRSKSGCKKTKGPSNSSLNKADNEDEMILKATKPCNETISAEDGATKSAAPEKNIDSDQLINKTIPKKKLILKATKRSKPCNETKSAEDGATKSAAPEKNIESDQLINKTILKKKLILKATKPCNETISAEDGATKSAAPEKDIDSDQLINKTIPKKKLILKATKPCNETKSAEDGATKSAAPEKNNDSDQLIAVDVTILHREDKPVWFSLVASEDEEEASRLPQLSSRFLRIKTTKMAVSYIQKYIAKKFELAKEDEVVIKFQGEALLPSTLVCEVEERWITWGLGLGLGLVQTKVGCSAEEYVMPLTYSKTRNQAQQPSL